MFFSVYITLDQAVAAYTYVEKDRSITYSSVGLVGGGLAIAGIFTTPFTFGASLGLTVAGIATGVTSGVAGVTHGAVKFGIVKNILTMP